MKRVDAFDGLRGMLVLWVLFNHAWFVTGLDASINPLVEQLVLQNIPVKLFVLVSGFAVFHSLRGKQRSYAAFLRARFWRTIPTYLLVLALSLLTLPLLIGALTAGPYQSPEKTLVISFIEKTQPELLSHFLTHALMVHGLIPKDVLPGAATALAPHLWILSTFWQFYVLAPVIFFLFLGRRPWLVATLWLGVIVLQSALVGDAVGNAAFFGRFLMYFLVGALSALLWERCADRFAQPLAPGLSLVATGSTYLICTDLPLTIWVLVATAAFCTCTGSGNGLDRKIHSLLASPSARFLGTISYELYLCHFLVLILPLTLANSLLGATVEPGWHLAFVFFLTTTLSIPVAIGLRQIKWVRGKRAKSPESNQAIRLLVR